MRRDRQRLVRSAASILAVMGLPSALLGQLSSDARPSSPVTTDWSQQHVTFSRPATADMAGRLERDPRYQQRQNRKSARLPEVETSSSVPSRPEGKLSRDWSRDLGSGAKVGAINYPAKYSLQTTTTNCANAVQPDFVVYGTGLAGSATQANIAAYDNLYSGCTGTVPTVYWAFNTNGTVTTSPVFSRTARRLRLHRPMEQAMECWSC